MGDIKVLLREAVPVDGTEPDLAAVVDRVRQRRARRRATRLGALAAAVALAGGVAAVAPDLAGGDGGDGDVATAPPASQRTRAEEPDASAFARLLAARGWLASAGLTWPAAPSEFLAGPSQEGMIVVGTLADVRPGPVTGGDARVETVIHIDLVAQGAQAHPNEIVVPWVTQRGGADQARSDELAAAFEDVAPIGARVLVYLRPGDGDPYEWVPQEPSGIVIEDGGGVAVPQPDPGAPDLDLAFDDYLAELDRLYADRLFHDEP